MISNKWQILGGSLISRAGAVEYGSGQAPDFQGLPELPDAKTVFETVPARFGRFDMYTRLGTTGIALALKNARLNSTTRKRGGVIIATGYECMQTDLDYYSTTLDGDGAFSSPNLFSYTLPGIVIGESAILFQLFGPGFTTGLDEGYGLNAVRLAMECLDAGQAEFMVTGWLDAPPQFENLPAGALSGAAFLVIGSSERNSTLSLDSQRVLLENRPVNSIFDLFQD